MESAILGISDSDSEILGIRFQNFWMGTHVILESVILGISDSDSKIFWNDFRVNLDRNLLDNTSYD